MAFVDRVRFADYLAQMRSMQVVHQQVERDITFIERRIGILRPVGGHVEERGEHAAVNLPERVVMALRDLKIDARIPWLDRDHIHVDQVVERALGQELHDRLRMGGVELLVGLTGVLHDVFFLGMEGDKCPGQVQTIIAPSANTSCIASDGNFQSSTFRGLLFSSH